MVELLAPAGSPEAVTAAVQSGADAVYLSFEDLTGCRRTENIPNSEFESVVRYCRIRGCRVYLALNIPVREDELNKAAGLALRAQRCGVDAIIVRDLGLFRILRSLLPEMPLFADAHLPVIGFRPDIIHCHDWQTGLVPVYLHDSFQQNEFFWNIKTIMTIHNLKFQGVWDVQTIKNITGLSDYYFTADKLEAYKDANYLKGGIVFADAVTTVSNTYAEEIKTPFYGEKLDGLMCARANSLRGIVNGIDYNEFNPETDPYITKTYNATTFRKEKVKNKLQLQRDLGLQEDPKTMMIGIVSRLTDQKGFDLIAYVMDELCQDAIQLVVLGTGDERYENMFRHFDWKYHGKVSAQIYYDEKMSHRIYASADAFLMPSLFEPCGLSQLMSLRYGTLPIVRETGGLKDTVVPYNEYEGTGTGFSFRNYNAHEMLATVRNAERIYYDKKREWNKMVDRAMAADFSWGNSARQYEEMYNWLIGDK